MSDSKEHIVLVASKLFLQKSFKEVTMSELVKATGLSKGAFYHYFESKEQLFLAVLDFFFTNVMTHRYDKYSRESFYQFYHDYAAEIHDYGKRYLERFEFEEDDRNITQNYFMLAFDGLKLFPEFKEKMVVGLKEELDIWTEVIRNAREKGEIKSLMTDEQIARTFINLSDGIAMHMIINGSTIMEMIPPFMELWDKLYEMMKA